jgi:cbb3-type cytochrome oxidase subunit 3
MDTFPYDSWDEAGNAAREAGEGFFTFGPGDNLATIVLVILMIAVTFLAFVFWVRTENRKLTEQAERLRASAGEGM